MLYRKIQYKIFMRHVSGVMAPGEECDLDHWNYSINHGDVVHPCVRYIPDGYLGHKWWLVYTPYYKANAKLENPLLFWGDSSTVDCPSRWKFYCEVKGAHDKGYNSDPNLVYNDDSLYVLWRENQTSRCDIIGKSRATFVAKVVDNGVSEFSKPIMSTTSEHLDNEVSPAVIRFKGQLYAYAIDIKFFRPWIRNLPNMLGKVVNKIVVALDIIGICSYRISNGIAVWRGQSLNTEFGYIGTYRIKNRNKLYHPWHIDIFEYKESLFAVIQSNQCNADILLAKSDDGKVFTLYKKPLVTNASIGKVGIYKASAIVVDGVFHLFYTAQDKQNRSLNKLYHTSADFEGLLSAVK